MKRILSVFVIGFVIFLMGAYLNQKGTASTTFDGESSQSNAHGLSLSTMQVKITSQGNTATFQLYDTVAAKEF